MYCVKCGVKLQDGVENCPLCSTPVWNPDNELNTQPTFPNRYPTEHKNYRIKVAILSTCSLLISFLVSYIVWINVGYGIWGGITFLGIAFLYLTAVFPLWFKKLYPFIWLIIFHAALEGYTLYICCITGGNWFLPFAFPVIGIHGIITITIAILLQFIKNNRCFILGGGTIAFGGYTMLIEFFVHITFGLPMFVWSIYSAAALSAIGILLLIAGIIKPFKNFLQKNLFF